MKNILCAPAAQFLPGCQVWHLIHLSSTTRTNIWCRGRTTTNNFTNQISLPLTCFHIHILCKRHLIKFHILSKICLHGMPKVVPSAITQIPTNLENLPLACFQMRNSLCQKRERQKLEFGLQLSWDHGWYGDPTLSNL